METMPQRGQGLFIAGTDTGVGKTVVSAALVSLLRAGGMDAVPMKPVQTGCFRRGKILVAPDLEFCLRMSGLSVSAAEQMRMAPYRFVKACSPHLAAAQAGQHIAIRRIVESFRILRKRHSFVIVEGAGGLLVPLNEQETNLDLIRALGLPVVLVARPGLGTINHTLLSLRELDRAGVITAGVVFNKTNRSPWGDIEEDNIATVERLGRVMVLGRLPYVAPMQPAVLRKIAARHLPFVSGWTKPLTTRNNAKFLKE
jgi:dethiobiotin synthetase